MSMSPLQWALLIFGVVAVVAVYLYSRRDRRAMDDWNPNEPGEPLLPPAAKERQLDIFNGENQQFDEFGVGKPRRVAPTVDGALPDSGPIELGGSGRTAPVAKAPPSEKIVSLLIAEREGTHILGGQIHEALRAQGLEYGARQIYHRMLNGEPVFSVASLLKPGRLDPAAAGSFSTPGLTLFMVLPGPQRPADAIRDMLGTADRLARALNAEVFDSKRKPLSAGAARSLQLEVESWALQND
ncbi:MAG: cell division protein ZipA C-terminal FtsZ-binding domain-containing protein [Nevskia sp.]|nr:cell division protein ZipA C-terminal FtsZ-binding domain-containing protein [Nevskia sp.]